ncbi:hypothetical protein [Longimicrobium sp.]|uniref:hypothetical protein n=1 Tax=Longimicrobium sp. TaxID=2029185 RepID=UPI002E2EB3E4|nr:hypothetical protein [Longimicrobium sp.]HEX6042298.1 hypothetical protein [Longimicrobium sp.]
MGTSFRLFAVLLIGLALGAAAVSPRHTTGGGSADFTGSWITWAAPAAAGERPVCRRLLVGDAGPDVREGAWDAPGWNGQVSGTVSRGDRGTLLRGEWRDGQIAGTIELALRDPDTFEGTFNGAGLPAPQRWKGVRASGSTGLPHVPCRMEN